MEIFILFLIVVMGVTLGCYFVINNKNIKITKEKSKLYKSIIDLNSLYEFDPIFSRGFCLTFKPKSKQELDNLDYYRIVMDKLKRNKNYYNDLFQKIKSNKRKYKEYSNRYVLLEKYTTEEDFLKFKDIKIKYKTFFNCEKNLYKKLKTKKPVVEYTVNCHAKFSYPYGKYIYFNDKNFNFEQLQEMLNKINDTCKIERREQEKQKNNIIIDKNRKQNLEKARLAKINKRIEEENSKIAQIEIFVERYNNFIVDNNVMKYIKAFTKSNLLTVEGNLLLMFIPSIKKHKEYSYFSNNNEYIQLFNEDSINLLNKYKKDEILLFLKNNKVLNSVINSKIDYNIFFALQREKNDSCYRNNTTDYHVDFVVPGFFRKEIVNKFEALVEALKNKDIIADTEIDKEILFLILGELYFEKTCNQHLKNYRSYKGIISKCKDYEEFIKKLFLNKKSSYEILSILNGKSIEEENFTIDIFYENKKIIFEITNKIEKERKSEKYLKNLLKPEIKKEKTISIVDIDVMSGKEFERCISDMFKKMGYYTKLTKDSNDQGIDVVVEKDSTKVAIQAKCYSKKVGNHAIMEAVAGMKYYKADKCMVVTNNYFTPSAINLAKVNNVELWDRDVLIEKIEGL